MCFSAIGALFSSVMIRQMSQAHPEALQDTPAIFRFLPLLAPVQVGVGILGIIAGINFLKLKSWARIVLEVLTWLLLFFILVFGIFFVSQWSGHGPSGFMVMGAVMGVVILGIYAVPLLIIVKYLRGNRVKNAMISSA